MRTKSSRSGKTQPAARSRKAVTKTARKTARKTGRKAAPKAVSPDLRHISRTEKTPKQAAGWKAGVMRRGKAMHKHFADSKYGGKTKALSAAKAWRDKIVKSTSDVDYVLWRREKRSRPSGSGIVGVGRYVVRYESSRHPVWEASWQDADGRRHSRRFFISVHGERGAKALAIAARRDATEELRRELIRRGAPPGEARQSTPRVAKPNAKSHRRRV